MKENSELLVVVGRDSKKKPWELITLSSQTLARTWQSALSSQKQEKDILGEKSFEVNVATAESWYAGRVKFLPCPPEGKEPLPSSLPEPPKEEKKINVGKFAEPTEPPKDKKIKDEPSTEEKKSNVGKFI